MSARSAVVLLSGGLDSATTLVWAQRDGFTAHAMTFRYGQRHEHEVGAALRIGARYGVTRHMVIDIDLRRFGGSALTGDLEVPKSSGDQPIRLGIPVTYVPARNTIFLSYALAWAEVLPAQDIFIGVNALDYSGYPDCRPEYIGTFEQLANLATRAGLEGVPYRIHAPLMHLTKAQIIRRGLEMGVDYSLTTSCYDPREGGIACGRCEACHLRERGFAENGIPDPIGGAAGQGGCRPAGHV